MQNFLEDLAEWTPLWSSLLAAASNVAVPLFFPPFQSFKECGFEKGVLIAVRHRQPATGTDPSLRVESFCFHGEKMFQELSLCHGSISNGNRPDGKWVWNPSCQSDSGASVETALVYISRLAPPKPVATWSLRHEINSAASLITAWVKTFLFL